MSIDRVKIALTWNIVFNSKSVENLRKLQLQKLFQITSSISTEFSRFFFTFQLFFLMQKQFLGLFLNLKNCHAGPPFSGYAATRCAFIGLPGCMSSR
jgi:hypothetical protein